MYAPALDGRAHVQIERARRVESRKGTSLDLVSPLNYSYLVSHNDEVTQVLKQWSDGSGEALEQLMALVYPELMRMAERRMRRERRDHTLEPGALVSETYLKLRRQTRTRWQSGDQFFRVAASLMVRILTDHFRLRGRSKRPPPELRMPLSEDLPAGPSTAPDLAAIEKALAKLEAREPRQAQVIELRFYAGLSVEQTAQLLGVAPATVKRDWSAAKAWLLRELGGRTEL
jgi:RNA polymerase sigma-70 factor (ECF subfamily)